jgi:imidazolonepropionase-like amidohydrolase
MAYGFYKSKNKRKESKMKVKNMFYTILAITTLVVAVALPQAQAAEKKKKEGAYADLLIVDGNPLEDIKVLEGPENNLCLIMKDGMISRIRFYLQPHEGIGTRPI